MKAPRLNKQQKREQAVIDLLNQMFVIDGHNVTYEDIKGRTDNWWTEWTMTFAQGAQYVCAQFNRLTKATATATAHNNRQ